MTRKIDPIARDDYRKDIYRDPNPERIAAIEKAAQAYWDAKAAAEAARTELDQAIIDAHATGHSFGQMRAASGLSISAIQNMLTRNGRL